MSGAWQGFLAILGVGVVVLLIAALADRRTRLRGEGGMPPAPQDEADSADGPPDSSASGASPTYLTTTELLKSSKPQPVDPATSSSLRGATDVALTLASPDLATHDGKLSLATEPRVLICDDPVTTVRELLPVWASLSDKQALTVAAPAFDPAVIESMAANTRAGVRVVQALVGEADARAGLADLTGATPVGRPDRQAGDVPATALGRASLIAADSHGVQVVR